MGLSSIEIHAEYYRLIPSRFPPIPIYARIAPDALWDGILAVEQLTNPRLAARTLLAGEVKEDTAPARFQNWNHAPFVYSDPEGTCYLDPRFGTLELADSRETALVVSVRRRERFLEMTKEQALGLDMRLLKVPVSGRFADARVLAPSMEREERWRYGQQVLDQGLGGVLYPCPVRKTGMCLSVFDPQTLGRSVQAEHYRLAWNGEAIPSLYDFQDGVAVRVADLQPAP